jgi:hypothetical protein
MNQFRARAALDLGTARDYFGRAFCPPVEQCIKFENPEAARVAYGPGEIAWTRTLFGPNSAAM